ncbi:MULTISPECIES: potassium channel family protein [unclassified Leifsonia]|uniref:potassium channel family protein n=1 Tax=unclassified Leifsonia TaxID=2663824 RepID=UPI0006F753B0|nr:MULTISPECIES: potassium channel family protein [unclassified Leifsonia]
MTESVAPPDRIARGLERRKRWESFTTIPLVVLGVGFIVFYSIYVLVPDAAPWLRVVLGVELIATWAVFVIDYLVRLLLTPRTRRWMFVRQNPIDLLSVILPLFRALRVLVLLRDVPYFRNHTGASIRAEVITYASAFTVTFVYFIALATLHVERDAPGATITSFGESIWWACVTLATVGYGDAYPITFIGRCYAVLLMVGGVAIVGTASAIVISYLSERMARLHLRPSPADKATPMTGADPGVGPEAEPAEPSDFPGLQAAAKRLDDGVNQFRIDG